MAWFKILLEDFGIRLKKKWIASAVYLLRWTFFPYIKYGFLTMLQLEGIPRALGPARASEKPHSSNEDVPLYGNDILSQITNVTFKKKSLSISYFGNPYIQQIGK